MRRMLILFLLICGLFTACAQKQELFFKGKTEFYKINLNDKKYYFSYPSESTILPKGRDFYLHYGFCTISFGQSLSDYVDLDEDLKMEKKEDEGKRYESYFRDGKLVAYAGVITDLGYVFLAEKGVENCMDFIDYLTKSFTDELSYKNEKFGFSLVLPADFKIEYLPEGEGVLLKKWIEAAPEEDLHSKIKKTVIGGYKVEIVVYAFENLEKISDLSQYIARKYHGYNIEFSEVNGIGGYYVDEGVDKDAKRHFYVMSKDGEFIYEAYIKVPSMAFEKHKASFEQVVDSIKIF